MFMHTLIVSTVKHFVIPKPQYSTNSYIAVFELFIYVIMRYNSII